MEAIWALVRHALTTVGGGLVVNGYATADEVTAAAGAVATLLGVAWSIFVKYKSKGDA